MDTKSVLNDVYDEIRKVNNDLFSVWKSQILFSWRWWLNIVLSVIPWVVWIIIRDKKDTARLLFVGVFASLVTNVLDIVGLNLDFWHYDWKIFPIIPTYLPWDFTFAAVGIMIFLQFQPQLHPLIKAAIYGGITAFLIEPLFSLVGLYHLFNWKYIYSFFIYFALYMLYHVIFKMLSKSTISPNAN